jgi:hypothetical protein
VGEAVKRVACLLMALLPALAPRASAEQAQSPVVEARQAVAPLLKQAREEIDREAFNEAEPLLHQALRTAPSSAMAHAMLAVVRSTREAQYATRVAIERARGIAALDADAHQQLQQLAPVLKKHLGERWPGMPPAPATPQVPDDLQQIVADVQGNTPPALKRNAARRLGLHLKQHPGLLPVAVEAIKQPQHPSVYQALLGALGMSDEANVWPFVADFLGEDLSPPLRTAAAEGLEALGYPARGAAPLLIAQLAEGGFLPATAAAEALGAMVRTAPPEGDLPPGWEEALQRALASRFANTRAAAIGALHQFRRIPEGVAAEERRRRWLSLLRDEDSAVATAALQALHHPGDLQEFLPVIQRMLERDLPPMQAAAADAVRRWVVGMRRRGMSPAAPAPLLSRLRALTGASDLYVRIEANAALAWLHDQTPRRRDALQEWVQERRLLGTHPQMGLFTAGDLAQRRLRQLEAPNESTDD